MPSKRTMPVAEHFWSKVNKNGPVPAHRPDLGPCWLWTATHRPAGYGTYYIDRYPALAHRVAWKLANGAIPDDLRVCHHCDNPPCVRPTHLFLGTDSDNQRDSWAKGRHVSPPLAVCLRGERCPWARLTEQAVREIRLRYYPKYGVLTTLAIEYGVTSSTIKAVVTGKNWKHVR